jgi:S-formylglutathione hydrolase FrmB
VRRGFLLLSVAAQLVTWPVTSKNVDPAKTPMTLGSEAHQLRVDVWLPAGYDGKRRFPVLYLLHGHGGNYRSWSETSGGDLPYIAGNLQAIVVMPEAGNSWYANWWAGGRDGGGRAWEYFFEDELIPQMERRLRIKPGRSNHAIGGLSMGGEGAAFLGAMMPGYFGTVMSFSGPLSLLRPEWPIGFDTQGENHNDVFGDRQKAQFYWAGHDPTTLARNLASSRVFVRVGDGLPDVRDSGELTNGFGIVAEADLRQHAQDFVAAARKAGVAVHYEPVNGIHAWPYWRLALTSAMHWGLFKPVATPSSWTYSTVAQHGRAWDVRFEFSSAPAALETFKRDGNTLSAKGSGTVRVVPDGARPFTASLPFSIELQHLGKAARRR